MVGTYRYHAVKVPQAVQDQMDFSAGGKQRFEGTLNSEPYSGALMPTGTGRFYLMVGGELRKRLRLELGDTVEITLTIVDPDVVHVPADVMQAISADGFNLYKWETQTAGNKCGLLHEINTAKTPETRATRIQLLMERLERAQPGEPIPRKTKP